MAMVCRLKVVPDRKKVPVCATTDKFARKHRAWYRDTLAELLDAVGAGEIRAGGR